MSEVGNTMGSVLEEPVAVVWTEESLFGCPHAHGKGYDPLELVTEYPGKEYQVLEANGMRLIPLTGMYAKFLAREN
jgi:hypothetical protein